MTVSRYNFSLNTTLIRWNIMKTLEKTDKYHVYENNADSVIFEMYDAGDYDHYFQGYKKSNPKIWRHMNTSSVMFDTMNKFRHKLFSVKHGNNYTNPNKIYNDYI